MGYRPKIVKIMIIDYSYNYNYELIERNGGLLYSECQGRAVPQYDIFLKALPRDRRVVLEKFPAQNE